MNAKKPEPEPEPSLMNSGRPRVALVTGSGARRVGNAVARRLAADGYQLALHAHSSVDALRQTAAELEAAGTPALPLVADLTDEAAVRQLIHRVVAHFGRIDALVNCAAIWERKHLEDVTADDVRRHFETNTLSAFLCCQQVAKVMIAQHEGGAMVNIGDWATIRPYIDYSAYFVSKAAIPGITRMLAVELAQRNPRIRVNAILPGPVMLPDSLSKAERQAAIAGTLVKREGTPEHVADAVAFLLGNDFVTGVCLPVDGGRSVYAM